MGGVGEGDFNVDVPMGRQTSAKATLPLLLGGWSGAAISSTE